MEKSKSKLEVITQYFDDFSDTQLQQLAALEQLYKEWNEKINVISRKDIDALYEKHVLHSLAIAAIFNFKPGAKILDIGTGGGFPGIPLAILFPEVKFYLVDSIGKKTKVVEEVIKGTGLTNVTVQHTRAEEIKYKYDFVVSRAVAPLKELWKWGRPLIRPGQQDEQYINGLICLKGGDLKDEIKESALAPALWDIHQLFKEEFFDNKYILYVPKRNNN